MKKVIFATLRDNKGATGGPGGVLYMLVQSLGKMIDKNIVCEYWFNTIPRRFKIKGLKYVNRFIFRWKAKAKKESYFIVHDIDSAAILADLQITYSLVYHNQGPMVQEMLNFGVKLSDYNISKIQHVERKAFVHAVSVHFPSNGASDMYFDNRYRSCNRCDVKIGTPLYNTILLDSVERIDGLDKRNDCITMFSLGTLTAAKGQDQTIEFIEVFLKVSQKKVRYIFVGQGPLLEVLIEKCKSLKTNYSNFEYIYIPKLSHSEIMYVHSIADVYVMRHRLSIFDFATLEAMIQNNVIVLSPVGGNRDFDKKSNVIFIINDLEEAARKLDNVDLERLKDLNKEVFEKFFSKKAFIREYIELIKRNIY